MERKSKILIGETSLFAQDCARALQNLGCLVTLCEKNGNSIISALSGAYYDAVVAELFMPGADGADVLEHISQFDEKPIALILLNSDDYKLQQRGNECGCGLLPCVPCGSKFRCKKNNAPFDVEKSQGFSLRSILKVQSLLFPKRCAKSVCPRILKAIAICAPPLQCAPKIRK